MAEGNLRSAGPACGRGSGRSSRAGKVPIGREMDFSAGYLFASLFVSTIGFGVWIYGKKQRRMPQSFTGLAMIVYPYFLGSPAWILGIGAALLVGLWLVLRAGT